MMEWISVKEKMPDLDSKVLVYTEDLDIEIMLYAKKYSWGGYTFIHFTDGWGSNPTHWMPLPKPPITNESTL